MGCPEENNWEELYEVRGDRLEQDIIRTLNPNSKHCDLLKMSPNACEGCPKSPASHLKSHPDLKLVEEYRDMINRGFELFQEFEEGTLKNPDSLPDLELIAFRQARAITEDLRDERLAIKIVRGVARLFGGKES